MSEEMNKFGGKVITGMPEFIDKRGYVEKATSIMRAVGNLKLSGETGTGKTHLAYWLAQIHRLPLFEDVMTQDTTRWDLLACDTLKGGDTVTRKGIITLWLEAEKGIAYIDGANYMRASVFSLIESIADFRGSVWVPELGRQFKRSNQHFIIISYNPAEKRGYSGTYAMNIATIRRFEGLVIDYLPAIEEKKLIKQVILECATDNNTRREAYDFASKFVEIARKSRVLYKRGNLRAPLTTGNLKNYARLWAKEHLAEDDLIEIAESLYPEDERTIFRKLFEESGEIDLEKIKNSVS